MNKTMHSLEKHQTRDTKRGKNLTFFIQRQRSLINHKILNNSTIRFNDKIWFFFSYFFFFFFKKWKWVLVQSGNHYLLDKKKGSGYKYMRTQNKMLI